VIVTRAHRFQVVTNSVKCQFAFFHDKSSRLALSLNLGAMISQSIQRLSDSKLRSAACIRIVTRYFQSKGARAGIKTKRPNRYKLHSVCVRISPYGTSTGGIVSLEFSQSGCSKALGYACQNPLD
jgi:hypothetical protein